MTATRVLQFANNMCQVDTTAFKTILDKVGPNRFVLYSINGRMRLGKSLTLNYLLRSLRLRATKGHSYNQLDADDIVTCRDVGGGDTVPGFQWGGGIAAVTQGIYLWSEPFWVSDPADPNGPKIAILLMDTQGLFDDGTTRQQNSILFSFSILCSSVMIYNSPPLDENALQNIENFVDYASATTQGQGQEQHQQQVDKFQKFLFLIRDFPYPYEFRYGLHTQNSPTPRSLNFVQKILLPGPNQAAENQDVRQRIFASFKSLDAFLLPDPGPDFRQSQNGNIQPLLAEFRREMKKFVDLLVSPEYLEVKTIFGQPCTGTEFKGFVDEWGEAYRNMANAPSAPRLAQLNGEQSNQILVRRMVTSYEDRMAQFVARSSGCEDDVLLRQHVDTRDTVLTRFEQNIRFGSPARRAEIQNELRGQLEAEFEKRFRPINNQARVQASLLFKNRLLIGGMAAAGTGAVVAMAASPAIADEVAKVAYSAAKGVVVPLVLPQVTNFVTQSFGARPPTVVPPNGPRRNEDEYEPVPRGNRLDTRPQTVRPPAAAVVDNPAPAPVIDAVDVRGGRHHDDDNYLNMFGVSNDDESNATRIALELEEAEELERAIAASMAVTNEQQQQQLSHENLSGSDDEALKLAIEASLQDCHPSGSRGSLEAARLTTVYSRDDEDTQRAIEASLRDLNISQRNLY